MRRERKDTMAEAITDKLVYEMVYREIYQENPPPVTRHELETALPFTTEAVVYEMVEKPFPWGFVIVVGALFYLMME